MVSKFGKFHPIDKNKGQIYVPKIIMTDPEFPFHATTTVQISIDKSKLIISEGENEN